MGQRLNIEIHEKGKILANAYYHWSAYTSSATQLVDVILSNFDEIDKEYSDPILKAIKLLETTGARIYKDDIKCAKQKYGDIFGAATSRNDGLISITEKSMGDTQFWQEGSVIIDIANRTIIFDVLCHSTKEEYNEDRLEFPDYEDISTLPILKNNPSKLTFETFYDFKDEISNIDGPAKLSDDEIIQPIE